jgi:ATP-dependent Zn protease
MEVMPARRALSAVELRRMAVHEAGHAILCVLLSSDVLHHVYIERSSRRMEAGGFWVPRPAARSMMSSRRLSLMKIASP